MLWSRKTMLDTLAIVRQLTDAGIDRDMPTPSPPPSPRPPSTETM